MYLYETHVHSLNGSLCGKCTPQELVRAYKQAGYTGFILSYHLFRIDHRALLQNQYHMK